MSYMSVVICLAVLGSVAAAPNVSKNVILEKQIPAANEVTGSLGASASWGPYSAGAGLGGNSGNGGLFAGASSPHGNAGAGLGGGGSSSASASASAGGTGSGSSESKPQGGTFFDKIFNIPISILQSVNSNLNANGRVIPHRERLIPVNQGTVEQPTYEYVRIGRRGGVRKRVYVKGDVGANAGGSGAASDAGASSSASASASASSGANASGDSHSSGHTTSQVGVRKNYDAAFSIPITALRSVNEFLNGK